MSLTRVNRRVLTAENVAREVRDIFDGIDNRLNNVGVGLDLAQYLFKWRERRAVGDAP